MKHNWTQYVHEQSDGTWGLGEWDENHAQYTVPLDSQTAKLTGCSAEFAKRPIGHIASRTRALRMARYLWGEMQEPGY